MRYREERIKYDSKGAPGWLSGLKPLPLAQVMIPGSWDRALHRAFCSAGSLLLPLSLPLCLLVISLSNKYIKSLKNKTNKNKNMSRLHLTYNSYKYGKACT